MAVCFRLRRKKDCTNTQTPEYRVSVIVLKIELKLEIANVLASKLGKSDSVDFYRLEISSRHILTHTNMHIRTYIHSLIHRVQQKMNGCVQSLWFLRLQGICKPTSMFHLDQEFVHILFYRPHSFYLPRSSRFPLLYTNVRVCWSMSVSITIVDVYILNSLNFLFNFSILCYVTHPRCQNSKRRSK